MDEALKDFSKKTGQEDVIDTLFNVDEEAERIIEEEYANVARNGEGLSGAELMREIDRFQGGGGGARSDRSLGGGAHGGVRCP